MPNIINLGKVKFEFKGEYSNTTAYSIDDIVVYDNTKFIYKNSTSASGNHPLIVDDTWRYSSFANNYNTDSAKLKINTTYWDYFESEIQFGDYVGAWSNSTVYYAGQVVTGSTGAAYYATRRHSGDDPVMNLRGAWKVYIEGGPVSHNKKIQRFICQEPIGWRGHPKYQLHANTGWTWNGNVPTNTYGANGQSEIYNKGVMQAMEMVTGGLVAQSWDGQLATWCGSGYHKGPINNKGSTFIYHGPYDDPLPLASYWNAAILSNPQYSGADADVATTHSLDEYTLSAIQHGYDDPSGAGVPRLVSIAGGLYSYCCLMTDGSVWVSGGFNSGRYKTGQSSTSYHPPLGFHWTKDYFGGKRIVKVSMSTGMDNPANNNDHIIALDEDGEIWTWGNNASGQCGVGPEASSDPKTTNIGGYDKDNTTAVITPTNINSTDHFGGHKVVDVWATGGLLGNSWVLTQMGELWSCGYNSQGNLGHPTNTGTTTATHCAVFRKIDVNWGSYGGIQKFICHGSETLQCYYLLDGQGDMWTWGYNGASNLGTGNATSTTNTNDIAASPATFRRSQANSWDTANTITNMWVTNQGVDTNAWFALANGAVYGVGDNTDYQLDTGNTTESGLPVLQNDLTYCIKIHADADDGRPVSALAIDKDRNAYVKPQGGLFSTGLGDNGTNNTPVDINQRSGTSQYGWKELPLPGWMRGNVLDVVQYGILSPSWGGQTPGPPIAYVLSTDGRLKMFGETTTSNAVMPSPGTTHIVVPADHVYWGS